MFMPGARESQKRFPETGIVDVCKSTYRSLVWSLGPPEKQAYLIESYTLNEVPLPTARQELEGVNEAIYRSRHWMCLA